MQAVITNNLEAIRTLCKKHHVKELYVFGSAVRDDFKEDSDIDLLYVYNYDKFDFNLPTSELPTNPSDDFFNLKFSLEDLLGRKIDLISYKDIKNPYFLQYANEEKIKVYGEERPESVFV